MKALTLFFILCSLKLEAGESSTTLAPANQAPFITSVTPVALVKREDIALATQLFTVSATDADGDSLTFSIVYMGSTPNKFKVKHNSGSNDAAILLKEKLDYENAEELTFKISVSDGNGGSVESQVLTLYVLDVNDNAPIFHDLPYKASVKEDATPGTTVFNGISVTDADKLDQPEASKLKYSIQQVGNTFAMNENTGELTLNGTLDFRTRRTYNVDIIVKDTGGNNASTNLVVNVEDVQNKPPEFLNFPYRVEIPENFKVGDEINLNIEAQDQDYGIPNQVEYSFVGGNHDNFEINSQTGKVKVIKALDRDNRTVSTSGGYTMTVMAKEVTDSPQGETTANTTLTVIVEDLNDEKPTFNMPEYTAKVNENSAKGITISLVPTGTQMIVQDLDEGDNAYFKLSIENDPFNAFEILPKDENFYQVFARINVINESVLDFETTENISFDVVATESRPGRNQSSRARVNVNIINLNDESPIFDAQTYNINVTEGSPNHTHIFSGIKADDKDKGSFGEITYAILGETLFYINKTSGSLYTNGQPSDFDAEKIDVQYINVEAMDRGGSRSIVVAKINILDVNDNYPIFRLPEYSGVIRETVIKSVTTVQATDKDRTTKNNIISYAIQPGNFSDHFHINSSTGEIKAITYLDSEDNQLKQQQGKITLNVTATDSGSPPLTDWVPVVITIEDQNDNRPVFDESVYSVSVSENRTGGHVVNVTASDGDANKPNNEIIYRLDSGYEDKFGIDANSGEIRIVPNSNFDYDIKKIYTITVKAFDRGTPPQTGQCIVNVNITDVNNKLPIFEPTTKTVHINESVALNSDVYTYTATDSDTDSMLEYQILANQMTIVKTPNGIQLKDSYKSWFDIDATTGRVFVNNSLDREMITRMTLAIFVKDIHAYSPTLQNATAFLTVILDDAIDTPPTIIGMMNVTMAETNVVNTPVVIVRAEDKDEQDTLRYSLVNNAEGVFQIDQNTGQVSLNKSIDRETMPILRFTARVTDSANLNSDITVYVTVQDVNDNDPVFVNFNSSIPLPENSPNTTVVTTLLATDKDEGKSGQVLYGIDSGNDQGHFHINSSTGVISIAKSLDREEVASYKLTVYAKDDTANPRKTTKILDVTLQDVNDNAPEFTKDVYKSPTMYENTDKDFPVVTVTANDDDIGANGRVTYSCCDPTNATGLFKVDVSSGQVQVNTSLTNSIGVFYITVTATDDGTPSLSSTSQVLIEIEDINDNTPEFDPNLLPAPTFHVSEDATPGTYVASIKATDKDTGSNGQVRYKFQESAGATRKDWQAFDLDNATGDLTTNKTLDRETQAQYNFEVVAYDLGSPESRSARLSVTVQLKDINDHQPAFDRTKYPDPFPLSVPENSDPPVFIYSLNIAEDKDQISGSINATPICYFIVGGTLKLSDIDQIFKLEKFSGNLTLEKKIDREETASIDLYVKASDNCYSNAFSRVKRDVNQNAPQSLFTEGTSFNVSDVTMLRVKVVISDENDNYPVFTNKKITAGVTRGEGVDGVPLINLKDYVTDADEGGNNNLTFTFIGDIVISSQLELDLNEADIKGPYFEVNSRSGVITAKKAFPETLTGNFILTVTATDSGGLADDATVTIYLVTDKSRVKVRINKRVDNVDPMKNEYKEFFQNLTGVTVNIDELKTHTEGDKKLESQSDMLIHAVDANGAVWTANELITKLDDVFSSRETEWQQQYAIISVEPVILDSSKVKAVGDMYERVYIPIAVAIIAFLFLLLLLFIFLMWSYRRSYRRKLRAATAMAFSTEETNGLTHLEMPGTNQHTFEGSNPIYLEAYENPALQVDDDTVSNTSNNSLDENDVNQLNMYDEQEISLDLYNDETDHYTKLRPNYLDAALREHEYSKNQHNNELNHSNTEDVKSDLPPKEMTFTNPSFTGDTIEDTAFVNGMPTTEI